MAVAGCGGRSTEAPAGTGADSVQKAVADYKLETGDQVQILVYGQPDLSGKFGVDGNGNLTLPLVGSLHVEGQTATEIQSALTDALNKGFLVNAQVTVQIAAYRPFYILGEVNKPGSYPFSFGMTVRQAVAIAGGYTRRARQGTVEVFHSGQTNNDAVDAGEDYLVLPGDTIQIEKRIF